MVVRVTERERATILAALRRWLSYPAAREADSFATNRGKHKPLDDGEIQRLCKRISEIASKGSAAPLRRHSNNGAGMQKHPKLRADQLDASDLCQQR
jgi:hypothetical protein